MTRTLVDDWAEARTSRGGPEGGPGGIWTHRDLSGDQPTLVSVDTLNRYQTPGSGKSFLRL